MRIGHTVYTGRPADRRSEVEEAIYDKLDELDIPISFAGDGSATATPDGSYKLMLNGGAMTVSATPKAASLVPATGDMSNMPLWTALLLLFAVSALLSRRKKA